jgi:prepilin-type processing-associated H-X9-DG protein
VVLFEGRSLDEWQSSDNPPGPAKWTVRDGYVEVAPKTGSLVTKQAFGDVQVHIEFRTPVPAKGESQERGNSGVFLMGMYEVQVLDSYHNVTYADGHAGAVYGQFPPLVNASRPPGEWQTYDIVFHRPRFDAQGKVTRPARMTVIHNGVLIQDDVELSGPTANKSRPPYVKHADALPLALQDHGDLVRFKNIWIRKLE